MEDIFQSKLFKGIILSIALLIVLSLVFSLGVFVGSKKANYSFQWAEAYHRNFGGPQGGFFGGMMGGDFIDANGVFGQVIKIDTTTSVLTIKGVDNVEKTVLADNRTAILFQRKNIKLSELKINDNVVVIGDPDANGQIKAELIRVMPTPPK
jgi:hypothetical protein